MRLRWASLKELRHRWPPVPGKHGLWPAQADAQMVRAMTTVQWAGIARRTPTYLTGYRDCPGSQDRAQRRAEWLADLPLWDGMSSVLEAGMGCGRNLAALDRQRGLVPFGADICPEAVDEARTVLPQDARLDVLDLYGVPEWPDAFRADAVLTVAALCHLEPSAVPAVLRALAVRARRALVLLEHFDDRRGLCLKGPRSWCPVLRVTGPYALWTLSGWQVFGGLQETLARRGWSYQWVEVPQDLQAPGATRLLILRGDGA